MVALFGFSGSVPAPAQEQGMDEMWGGKGNPKAGEKDARTAFFREGNYGMFIHWGLYSHHGSQWKGKTFYGIGEWMMRQFRIPVKEYQALAGEFNPAEFDAARIVDVAKQAGMKWIIVTAKHHDGFAMFRSKHPFNIVAATPFKRDPMKELAEEARKAGLKFGFYYSHYQDWSAPGGNGGPAAMDDGTPADFARYFREKCLPQVEELCTQYGKLSFMWFDTPGKMPREMVSELAALVRKKQPGALMGSRIGHEFGDYDTLGDMEVPATNHHGTWETADTTNDSWGYSLYDKKWKSPATVLNRLVSVVGRGGSYLLNVGPDRLGRIPDEAAHSLKEAGRWISTHPQVVYNAGPSPWKQAMPWGDVTSHSNGKTLNAVVFDWPQDRKIYFPGMAGRPEKISLTRPDGSKVELPFEVTPGGWLVVDAGKAVDAATAGSLASLLELEFAEPLRISPATGIFPNVSSLLRPEFANATAVEKESDRWMEKFGEWKHVAALGAWAAGNRVDWDVDVAASGAYEFVIRQRGNGKVVWSVKTGEGETLVNQVGAGNRYNDEVLGQLRFSNPGKHRISLSLAEGNGDGLKLECLKIRPVK